MRSLEALVVVLRRGGLLIPLGHTPRWRMLRLLLRLLHRWFDMLGFEGSFAVEGSRRTTRRRWSMRLSFAFPISRSLPFALLPFSLPFPLFAPFAFGLVPLVGRHTRFEMERRRLAITATVMQS